MANLTMKKADIIAAVIVMPICLYVFYESTKWPVPALLGRPFLIPRGVAAFLLVAAGILLYRALKGQAFPLESPLVGADLRRVSLTAVLTFGYLPLLERIGFIGTTFLYLLFFAWVLGERRRPRLILFAILVPLVMYTLFSTALHVPLPRGWIENAMHGHGFAVIIR
jgi:tripartite tricarboxylate transporter TctB family protein